MYIFGRFRCILESRSIFIIGRTGRRQSCPYRNFRSVLMIIRVTILVPLDGSGRTFLRKQEIVFFTGCRRNEILELQWKDVKIERAMLLLPETKTGARPVYLSAPALSVLAALPKVSNNPFVIVGEKQGQHLVNLRKVWVRICKVARLRNVRLHDLRHSFASVGVSGGASLPIIGKLLGHAKTSTTEKYSHLAADPVRAVNEAMGNQIAAMLSGKKGTVVKFHAVVSS